MCLLGPTGMRSIHLCMWELQVLCGGHKLVTQKAEITAPFALHWGMSEAEKQSGRGKYFLIPVQGGLPLFRGIERSVLPSPQHGEGAAGHVASMRCSLWNPGCRKVGAKAGPAFPRWSDPVDTLSQSLLDPREDSGSRRYWSRLPVLGDTLWFNTETSAPPFLQDAYVEREMTQNV